MNKWLNRLLGRTPISIRWSLFRNMTLLVVLIAGSIILFTYINSSKSLRILAASLIRQSADHMETELKRFFEPIYGILSLSQQWGEAGILDPNNRKHLNQTYIPILKRFPQLSSINIGEPNGKGYMLLRDEYSWLNREVRPLEWGKKARWTRWKDANTQLDLWWEELDYDPRSRPWYKAAIELKEKKEKQQRTTETLAWTEPYPFYTTQEVGMTASTIVPTQDGSFFVLAFDILLDAISEFTVNVSIRENGKAFILSDAGNVIGLPNEKRFRSLQGRKKAIGVYLAQIGIPYIYDAVRHWVKVGAKI